MAQASVGVSVGALSMDTSMQRVPATAPDLDDDDDVLAAVTSDESDGGDAPGPKVLGGATQRDTFDDEGPPASAEQSRRAGSASAGPGSPAGGATSPRKGNAARGPARDEAEEAQDPADEDHAGGAVEKPADSDEEEYAPDADDDAAGASDGDEDDEDAGGKKRRKLTAQERLAKQEEAREQKVREQVNLDTQRLLREAAANDRLGKGYNPDIPRGFGGLASKLKQARAARAEQARALRTCIVAEMLTGCGDPEVDAVLNPDLEIADDAQAAAEEGDAGGAQEAAGDDGDGGADERVPVADGAAAPRAAKASGPKAARKAAAPVLTLEELRARLGGGEQERGGGAAEEDEFDGAAFNDEEELVQMEYDEEEQEVAVRLDDHDNVAGGASGGQSEREDAGGASSDDDDDEDDGDDDAVLEAEARNAGDAGDAGADPVRTFARAFRREREGAAQAAAGAEVVRRLHEDEAEMSGDEAEHNDEGAEDADLDGNLAELVETGRVREKKKDAKIRQLLDKQYLAQQDQKELNQVLKGIKQGFRSNRPRAGFGLLEEEEDLGTDAQARRRRGLGDDVLGGELDAFAGVNFGGAGAGDDVSAGVLARVQRRAEEKALESAAAGNERYDPLRSSTSKDVLSMINKQTSHPRPFAHFGSASGGGARRAGGGSAPGNVRGRLSVAVAGYEGSRSLFGDLGGSKTSFLGRTIAAPVTSRAAPVGQRAGPFVFEREASKGGASKPGAAASAPAGARAGPSSFAGIGQRLSGASAPAGAADAPKLVGILGACGKRADRDERCPLGAGLKSLNRALNRQTTSLGAKRQRS
ncbi:unnamed protein product [Pedinophyceae sp. YPF-701]|nr:unnamed protein product [Pedinophyceae sp. YPF-701]